MKHYLVATDFSDNAVNAAKFAVELAKITKARITLVHFYSVPVMVSDAPVMPVIAYEDLQKDNLALLRQEQAEMARMAPEVKVDVLAQLGFANTEIIELGKSPDYDLIVMGIKGHGKVTEFFGSTATSVALNARIPALIVPAEARFKNFKSLAFAFDFREVHEPKNLDILREWAALFQAKINVLYVAGDLREIPTEKSLVAAQINDILEGVVHELSFPLKDEPITGIEAYVSSHSCDLLVMIRRKHGFFDRLLNSSYTRKMAFHTHIPLLVLHD